MVRGPLVPGWTEFDGPRRRVPRGVWWILVLLVVMSLAVVGIGVFRAAGPLASLGLESSPLQPVAFRPTTEETVLQVALSVPAGSLCRDDDVSASAVSVNGRIRVTAAVSRLRNEACVRDDTVSDPLWIDVRLDGPLADRDVVRDSDGNALPIQATTSTTGS